MNFTITEGFSDAERDRVAALYWQAFSSKLGVVLGPDDRGRAFIKEVLNPEFALVARGEDQAILGVAGFKTADGALVDGGLRDLGRAFGWVSCLWRAPLLALLERDIQSDVLQMDGICVAQEARSMGIGTALLAAIEKVARARGLGALQLDVIDTNPRARAPYRQRGFEPMSEERLGPLKWVFGFASSTKMQRKLG